MCLLSLIITKRCICVGGGGGVTIRQVIVLSSYWKFIKFMLFWMLFSAYRLVLFLETSITFFPFRTINQYMSLFLEITSDEPWYLYFDYYTHPTTFILFINLSCVAAESKWKRLSICSHLQSSNSFNQATRSFPIGWCIYVIIWKYTIRMDLL